MTNPQKQPAPARAHSVIMENRSRLNVSGVEDVESFDDAEIVMYTSQGSLIVRGSGLHIEKLSLENGELNVEGFITDLVYEEVKQSGSLWTRMFG